MASRIRDLIVPPLHRDAGETFLEYLAHFWNVTSSVLFCLGNSRIFLVHSWGLQKQELSEVTAYDHIVNIIEYGQGD